MNRLTGNEDGYNLRIYPTKKLIDAKSSMLQFIQNMNDANFQLSSSELNLLAHANAAIDELLHVYHKIVLDIDLNKNSGGDI